MAARPSSSTRSASGAPFSAILGGAAALSSLGVLDWLLQVSASGASFRSLWFAAVALGALGALTVTALQFWPSQRGSFDTVLAAIAGLLLPAIGFAWKGLAGSLIIYCLAGAAVAFLTRALCSRVGLRPWHFMAVWVLLMGVAMAPMMTKERGTRAPSTAQEGSSTLLITLDTTRADRIGVYGYARAETPNLDALAAEGAWFTNAHSHSAWTGPSHLSILTGLEPHEHGALRNMQPLSDGMTTIAHAFKNHGYATGAFVSGFPLFGRTLDVTDAFDHYDDNFEVDTLPRLRGTTLGLLLDRFRKNIDPPWRRGAEDTGKRAIAWLDSLGSDPFFNWVHFYDPHLPYTPEELGISDGSWYRLTDAEQEARIREPEALARLSSLYDAKVTLADAWLGQVVAAARERSQGKLWIVIASDHGESFGEHGLFYDRDSYEVTGRVPLIIVPPNGSAFETGQRNELVSLTDIAPTLLEGIGLQHPMRMTGMNLAGTIQNERFVRREHDTQDRFMDTSTSIRSSSHRLIERSPGRNGRFFSDGGMELYDLESDPHEVSNLAGTGHPAEAALTQELRSGRRIVSTQPAKEPALSLATERALRSLGYIK